MRRSIAWLATLLFVGTPASGQVHRLSDPGDSLLGVARRFVEARNTTDAARRLSLLNGLMGGSDAPRTRTSQFLGDLLRLGGTFEPEAYYAVGGGLAVHVVGRETRTGSWTRYQLGMDPARPNRIGMIAQTDSRPPPALPAGALSDAAAGEFLGAYAERLTRESGFSGALLVARGESVLVERYLGRADDRTGAAVTPRTGMNMASGSKMFTSVLIAQAVDGGRLTWDTPVGDVVPSLRTAPWSASVTIRHLMTHTSGLPEYWDEAFEAASGRVSSLEHFVPFFLDKAVQFAPGARAAYCNTNFIVLGLVLEALGDQPYAALAQLGILGPAGMMGTVLNRSASEAVAYEPTAPGAWQAVTLDLPPSSAGGASSTARDLFRFAQALRAGRLIPQAMLATMTAEHVRLGGGTAYGLGFEVAPRGAYWGHGGRGPGVTFDFRIYPASDLVVIVMSNRDGSGYLDLLLTVDEVLARVASP